MAAIARRIVFVFATTLLTSAALGAGADRMDTLYARLGGDAVITALVDETVDAVAVDPRVNQSFDKVDMKRLKKMIVEQICALSEGPCRYTGDDMQKSHAGLKIRDGEFFALVEALRAALDRHDVGTREKNELLRLLAPMKRDVVTR